MDSSSSDDDDDEDGHPRVNGNARHSARSHTEDYRGDCLDIWLKVSAPLQAPIPKAMAVVENLSWRNINRIGPGMYNVGNTCFLNAALQCLAYVPPVVNILMSKGALARRNGMGLSNALGGFNAMRELQNLLATLHSKSRSKSAVAPQNIVRNMRKIAKKLRVGRQEDAYDRVVRRIY